MVLARFVSPDDFGIIGSLAIIFNVANMLIDAGLGGSLIKEVVLKEEDCSTIFIFNFICSLVCFAIVFCAASPIGSALGIIGNVDIIRLLSFSLILSALCVVPRALIIRELNFKANFIIGLFSNLASSIIAIIIAILGFGIYSLVVNQLASVLLQFILSLYYSKYRFSFAFSLSSFKKLAPFGVYSSLNSIVNTIYENSITSITGKYVNMSQAGYLSQAKRLNDALSYSVAMTIGSVTFPVVTRLKEDTEKFNNEIRQIYKVIPLFVFPVLMAVAALSDEVVVVLFGDQWLPAGIYLSILMFAGIFIVLEALFNGFIQATGNISSLTLITFVKRSIGVGILFCFALWVNNSIIYGYLISSFIGFIFSFLLFCRQLKCSAKSYIIHSLWSIIPSILIYVIITTIKQTWDVNSFALFFVSFIILMLYYLVVLRIVGINVITTIRNIIKRK